MSDDSSVSRRRFLETTGGIASAIVVAGCGQSGPGADTETEGEDPTPTETEAEATPTESPTPTPTEAQDTEAPATETEAEQENEEAAQQPGMTLREINSTITTFDPVAATDTASGVIIQQVFDALMNYQNGTTTTSQMLASDYTVSDDFLTYTFDIEDATFHNGNEVTAQDLIYSFERLAASENSRRAYFVLSSLGVQHETDDEGNYVPGTLALNAVDEKTLEIQLSQPFHASLEMLAYSSFSAVPEGIVGDIPDYEGEVSYEEFAQQNPIGAGPFVFENWSQGTEASVTRYEDYHGTVANVAGVHWQVIEQDSPHFNYAMNRNADVFTIPTTQFDPTKVSFEREDDIGRQFGTYGPARNGANLNMMRTPTISAYYVGFNMNAVPKPVRQAMAYVMNQQNLVSQVFKDRGVSAYHFTPPSIFPDGAEAYTAHAQNGQNAQTEFGQNGYPYGYNQTMIDQARQVMEDAGYGSNNQYTLQWTQYQSSTWQSMASIIRDKLASVHVDMQIEQAPFATLTERGRQGNLEAYTLGWIADWPAPDNFLQLLNPPQTLTSEPAPVSYINWTSDNGDAADVATSAYETIQENSQPTDQAQQARNQAYLTVEEANWEDVGFINVYHAVGDRFWYDWVEFPASGPMGASRQKRNEYQLSQSENRPN